MNYKEQEKFDAMEAALREFLVRATFIGHPQEPMTEGFFKPIVPNWKKVFGMAQQALLMSTHMVRCPKCDHGEPHKTDPDIKGLYQCYSCGTSFNEPKQS